MEPESTPVAAAPAVRQKLSSPITYIEESLKYTFNRLDLVGWYFLLYLASLVPIVLIGGLYFVVLFVPTIPTVGSALVGIVLAALAILAATYIAIRNLLSVTYVVLAPEPADYWDGWRWSKSYAWSYLWIVTIVTAVVFTGFVFLIIPGIVLSLYLYLTLPVLVQENLRGMPALVRSYQLVKGYWWAVFGRGLLLIGMMLLINMLLGIVFAIVTAVVPSALDALFVEGVSQLISAAVGTFFAVLGIAFMGRFYMELAAVTPVSAAPVKSASKGVFTALAWLGLLLFIMSTVVGTYLGLVFLADLEAGTWEEYVDMDEAALEIELENLELDVEFSE